LFQLLSLASYYRKNQMTILRPLRVLASGLAIVLLSACSTQILKTPQRVPAYAGPLRSVDDVGVFLPVQLYSLTKVDGTNVSEFKRPELPFGMGGWEIELLPGVHTLEIDYHLDLPNMKVRSISPVVQRVDIQPGHVYVLRGDAGFKGRWNAEVVDVTESQRSALVKRRSATVEG
jgi:hypothetical protein